MLSDLSSCILHRNAQEQKFKTKLKHHHYSKNWHHFRLSATFQKLLSLRHRNAYNYTFVYERTFVNDVFINLDYDVIINLENDVILYFQLSPTSIVVEECSDYCLEALYEPHVVSDCSAPQYYKFHWNDHLTLVCIQMSVQLE